MVKSRCMAPAFQSFTSFISNPNFINGGGYQSHSYSDFLVNLGVVGFCGDPDILNKALKHTGRPEASSPRRSLLLPPHNCLEKVSRIYLPLSREVRHLETFRDSPLFIMPLRYGSSREDPELASIGQ